MADMSVEVLFASGMPEPTPLRRIRRLALPFEIGFGVLAALAVLLFLAILVFAYVPGGYVTFNSEGGWLTLDPETAPADALSVTEFPLSLQLAGLITGSLIYGGLIAALWSLHRLFRAYRRGQVFASEPIRLMRRSGVGLIVFAVVPGLMQPLLRALGSPDRNWFHGETIPIPIVGAALFLFAQIIALGVELERENKGFV